MRLDWLGVSLVLAMVPVLPAQASKPAKDRAKKAATSKPTKKKSGQWNTAVGLGGGGAGGKFGGRRLLRPKERSGEAVQRGLRWLADHQDADGSWSAAAFMKHDKGKPGKPSDGPGAHLGRAGATGLCLLTFLGDGNTMRSGPHRAVVKNAARWLKKKQNKQGSLAAAEGGCATLEHALATYGLCEAVGLSGYRSFRRVVGAAIEHLLQQQNPDGGWSAGRNHKASDFFTTCHAVMVCRTATDFRFKDCSEPLRKALQWFQANTQKDGSLKSLGDVPLVQGAGKATAGMSAGLLSRYFANQAVAPAGALKTAGRVAEAARNKPGVAADCVAIYFGSYAAYQVGQRPWRDWTTVLDGLLEKQRQDGNFRGSFDPKSKAALAGGRLYATVLSILSLEAYYRYTRLVR